MSPVVINRHHYRGKALPQPSVYIGRGTPLGNVVGTRRGHGSESLALYRAWLWERILRRDVEILTALNAISPSHHLVCSCAPAPCHGDVVVELWEWLAGKGDW